MDEIKTMLLDYDKNFNDLQAKIEGLEQTLQKFQA